MNRSEGDPIRFGVLGCGSIAYWSHIRNIRRIGGAELVAAADPDADARARVEDLTGVAVYEHAEEVLTHGDIDAVVVAAPTHLHADLAVAACEARKHVYIEKPIATTVEDARRVVTAAGEAGVSAAVGFNRRLHPVFRLARGLLRERKIGRVQAVQTAFCEPAGDEMPEWKRRRSSGGGVVLDLASHHIDLVRWLLEDEVEAVRSEIASQVSEDDAAWLQLVMKDGVTVQGFYSFRAGLADYVEVIGERATLRVDRHKPMVTMRSRRPFGYGIRTRWRLPGPATFGWRLDRLVRPSIEPSYRLSLAAFADWLRGGPRRLAGVSDGVRALDVVLAAEESARRGSVIPLASE